jgi:hypothetical protein
MSASNLSAPRLKALSDELYWQSEVRHTVQIEPAPPGFGVR